MQEPVRITTRDVALSGAEKAVVRHEVAKLEEFYDRIVGCRVLVETEHRYPAGRSVARAVRVEVSVPGGKLVVTRSLHEELLTAIRLAFDAARRQVENYARRQRRDVKTLDRQPHGRVSQLFPFEGYGFLESPEGNEIYFHRNSVLDAGFGRLEVGTEVRYVEEQGDNGPQASTVALIGKGPKGGRQESGA